MTESALWQKLNKIMGDNWRATRHEDILSTGVPDISFSLNPSVSGWIELKAKFSYRKGILKVSTFTPDQSIWLEKRSQLNGHCFVLAANEKTWFFIQRNFLFLRDGIKKGFFPMLAKDVDLKFCKAILQNGIIDI